MALKIMRIWGHDGGQAMAPGCGVATVPTLYVVTYVGGVLVADVAHVVPCVEIRFTLLVEQKRAASTHHQQGLCVCVRHGLRLAEAGRPQL